MQVKQVIKIINHQNHTNFQLLSRYEKGEWGAYRITEPGKSPVVLKFCPDLQEVNVIDPIPNVDLPKTITNRLSSLGYPVPKYYLSGKFGAEVLYWILEELPGKPLWENPTENQVKQMVSFLEMQQNQAVSSRQDYSIYVKKVVFQKRNNWSTKLDEFSKETSELLKWIMELVVGLENLELPNQDIVHGDFSYHQVMALGGKITGIIDWQEAGCGDWLIDLSRLIYSLHDRPHLTTPITDMLKKQDPRKIKLYVAYTALEMVSWRIDKNPTLSDSINKARSALNFIKKIY